MRRLPRLALSTLGLMLACEQAPVPAASGLHDLCYEGEGICVPLEVVGVQPELVEADTCLAPYVCVPRKLVTGAVAKTCTTAWRAEGRCLFAELPLIWAQSDMLDVEFCDASERCAPCFDPFTGAATGACQLPGDPGPVAPATVFGTCCEGQARCVSRALVQRDQQEQLATLDCSDTAALCVPQFLIDRKSAMRCASTGGVEGRCLPSCLPSIAAQLDRLPIDICATGQRCAPCADPLSGKSTGACELPGDVGVLRQPEVFGKCCEETGRCLPPDVVSAEQRKDLAQRDCAEGRLCAPDSLVDNRAPHSCTSVGGSEGRCLSVCLPMVESQIDRLPQASCARLERCAPCFDPFSGEATGACTLPGDPGPVQKPMTFDRCCSGAGSCVPPDLVPASQRADVDRGECNENQLCVPRSLIEERTPARCDSVGGFEGRCLPTCLPSVAAQAARLPVATCQAAERCVPCSDPITGAASGACSLPGDPGPTGGKAMFDACCEGAGSCVPPELLPAEQRSSVAQATCAAGQLCVPRTLATGSAPETCESVGSFEGRCLSTCLPLVTSQADLLPSSTCKASERCAPCFDPISGEASGACSLPGDRGPVRPPGVFAGCCELQGAARGRCVPRELVPSDQRMLLMADTCDANALCLPNALVPPSTSLPKCTSSTGSPGACVPSCMLTSSQRSLTTQGDCKAWERCVPCSLAGAGVCD